LLDLANQKAVDLSGVEILVLDEADRMLDMGFIRDIKKILALLPKARQNLLFSATFSDEIKALADGLLNNPGFVEVARRNTASELVEQTVHMISQSFKRELVSHLVSHNNWQQVLVFTRTKHGANRLAEKLVKDGIEAAAIHGNKSQGARTKALAQFKDGTVRVLVATDIAARGLDIDQLPQVINFELPNVPEDYVHRIGRTGRAGSSGAAVSLVDREELKLLKDIEKLIKREIPKVPADGWVQPEKAEPEAPRAPRPQQRRPQNAGGKPSQGKPQHNRNKPQGQRSDKAPVDGNRAPAQSPSTKNMSEAARHQAMPQPALFAPKPQNRGPNPNAGRNANRNNGGSRGGHTGGGGRGR
jgi:ATP-dependent RNA helicase RhlE